MIHRIAIISTNPLLSDCALIDVHGNTHNLYKVLDTGNIVNIYESASNEHALIYIGGSFNNALYSGISSLINSIQKTDNCSISGDINVIKNLDL